MQRLILMMIVVATTFEFFGKGDEWGRWAVFPREAKFVGDLLGAAALLYVIVAGTRTRFQFVRPAYWIVFGALLFTITAGIVINNVEPGPIFAGLRTYLHAIPWFFVGAVYLFNDAQIKKQLQLLLVVALVQVPLAIEQRTQTLETVGHRVVNYTGDFTTGTLISSATLSIFMISGMCVLAALLARQKLKVSHFGMLFLLLLIPPLINETKATLVLLPVGVIVAFIAAAKPGRRLQALTIATGLVISCSAIFISVYDQFRSEGQASITTFLTERDVTEEYLYKNEDIGTSREKPAGRVDSIVVPLKNLSTSVPQLVFGYGIGNVSDSALGPAYVGQYFELYRIFSTTAFSQIVLELGILGLMLVLVLMTFIYRDSLVVARRDNDLRGAIAAAMAGITAVITLSIVYKDLIAQLSMSFLFWYFAGLIAAHRMRISVAMRG